MSGFSTSFLFATCNRGWETALKAEVKRLYGGALTPAFLRPGLVTWKVLDAKWNPPSGPLPVFAHTFGFSLGRAKDDAGIPAFALTLDAEVVHLHVLPRVIPEDGFTKDEWEAIDRHHAAIAGELSAAGIKVSGKGVPDQGDVVLLVVSGDPDEPLFVGTYRHDRWHSSFAGGMPRVVLPEGVPSRAWLKMAQALAYAGPDEAASLRGGTVVELGSAPGGGSLSLLQHGAKVIGVDTGEMDERVLSFSGDQGASFTHLAASAGEVAATDLPRRVELLVSDMNLAPPVALRYIERIQRRVRAETLILTLKINDTKMEEAIPSFLKRIRTFAPGELFATQLPANRKEITVISRILRP